MATSSNSTTIPFHKHCQQTVCSAYGYGGQGATWERISELNLPHLDSDWKDLFTRNENNITEDLASILTLIDNVADQVSSIGAIKGFTISFQDANGVEIANQEFSASSRNYSVRLGRQVDLIINGETFSFNTMHDDEHDKRIGTLPEKKIDVKAGGSSIGSVNVVASDSKDLALTSKQVKFVGNDNNSVIATAASIIWPEDQTVKFTLSDVNLMQGSTGSKLIGKFKTIYPSTQSVALAENKLKLKVGNAELAAVPFISHEDKTLQITSRNLTLKAGNTTLGSAQIVADGDKTINLVTNNLKLTMGGTNLATVAIPMGSQANVNIPTKPVKFYKDAKELGTVTVACPDTNQVAFKFQQEYNLLPAQSRSISKSTSLTGGTSDQYGSVDIELKPGVHAYRLWQSSFRNVYVRFFLKNNIYGDEGIYGRDGTTFLDIFEFELHVNNWGNTLPRYLVMPSRWLSAEGDPSGWLTRIKDKMNSIRVAGGIEAVAHDARRYLPPDCFEGEGGGVSHGAYQIPGGHTYVFKFRLDRMVKFATIDLIEDYDQNIYA